MLGLESTPHSHSRHSKQPLFGVWNRLLPADDFREALEAEVVRHHRHLTGFGLLRIGPKDHFDSGDALKEAFETETRRSDIAGVLPDGSCVLLALHARTDHLALIAERLQNAASAVHEEYGEEPVSYVVGMIATTERLRSADEMWAALTRSFEDAKAGRRQSRAITGAE